MATRRLVETAASFQSLGLAPELGAALKTIGFERPSAVQSLIVPKLLRRQSLAFAASTGSGKTLAYLLPTMQHIKEQELARPLLRDLRVCRPQALVLAPTRDLVTQVTSVAKVPSRPAPPWRMRLAAVAARHSTCHSRHGS